MCITSLYSYKHEASQLGRRDFTPFSEGDCTTVLDHISQLVKQKSINCTRTQHCRSNMSTADPYHMYILKSCTRVTSCSQERIALGAFSARCSARTMNKGTNTDISSPLRILALSSTRCTQNAGGINSKHSHFNRCARDTCLYPGIQGHRLTTRRHHELNYYGSSMTCREACFLRLTFSKWSQ